MAKWVYFRVYIQELLLRAFKSLIYLMYCNSSIRWLFFLISILALATSGVSQTNIFDISAQKLVETKWRYSYTMHLETNTIIHQAEDNYDHFVYFKYDSTFRQYLNGKLSTGKWSMDGAELSYPFKQINHYTVTFVNDRALDLEFQRPNSKGTFVFHFIPLEQNEATLLRDAFELPEVWVEGLAIKKSDSAANTKRKKKNRGPAPAPTYISIELVGGGFYGGLDPVLRDNIVIKNDGRLVKEFKSVQKGLIVTKKNIPRDELEMFAEWLVAQKFFDLERTYDCKSALCEKRKFGTPAPVPLRLSVVYGNVRKMVTISIWGKDKNNLKYVDYPSSLDNIIDAIYRMANRV